MENAIIVKIQLISGDTMNVIEKDVQMLDGSLRIMNHLYATLRALPTSESGKNVKDMGEAISALYERKDKKDTNYFDIVAEKTITLGNNFFGHDSLFKEVYNQSGVCITEERGKVGSVNIEGNTPVIISDPTDKSSYLEHIIENHKGAKTMGEAFDRERELIGDSVVYEGVNASVTLLKDNMIKYSIVLNLMNGDVFVGYEPGVFKSNIQNVQNSNDVCKEENRVLFSDKEGLNTVFYSKGNKYAENMVGTHLRFFSHMKDASSPGGPIRFAYLLKDEGRSDVHLIAHNGEKIQESLPNIAMAYFSKGDLLAFKLFCDRESTAYRGEKNLTPNLQNSIYNDGLLVNTGLKLQFLNNHEYPSEFRDTTIIVPRKNDAALTMMEGMVKKEYAIRII
jgi:hypothetical protein